ncbi:OadG family transporter subunit [Endozoicomonas sp. GU-1]|uniref:OadG family protein n=1 Tax=Endozoicomonas sp. GU-1 TaxID=3009078 RepID=UPI0022B3F0D8|nr:OadG family transporter subunit [Endozoicomonas sp. GU-1]WBA79952.1 OadG family transporter subunit [Endozoicomonas sp. GU-1]WBA87526.1 OadG family transporter subunit [Endozoicomonas sp. GU-1]
MNPSDLISEGSSLMLFGMGFVFLFLTLLVLVTSLMSTIIDRYFQEPVPSAVANPILVNSQSSSSDDQGELIAVISAAIQMHRTKKAQAEKRQ